MKLRYIWAICFLLLITNLHAQQGLFQSASGDSSIFLSGQSGVISYNLGSSTARFDFLRDTGKRWAFGGGAGGTVNADAATLINKNSPAPGGFVEGGLIFLRTALPVGPAGKPCWHIDNDGTDLSTTGPVKTTGGDCAEKKYLRYFIVQFHYDRSQFNTLPSSTAPIANPTQVNFNEFRGTVAYNSLLKTQAADYRFGLAYVPASANNLADLVQDSLQTQVLTQSGSGQSILSAKSKTIFVGNYKEYASHAVNADALFQPGGALHYELGIDLMMRSELGGGSGTRYASPGIGAYIFKKGSPIVPVGGIAYGYRSGKSQIAITAGWTFGGTKSQ